MLSVQACRELLSGSGGDGLSDHEIEALRSQLYATAHCVVDLFASRNVTPSIEAATLEQLPNETRELVEERAAVLEFDANMSRDQATRMALQAFIVKARPPGPSQ